MYFQWSTEGFYLFKDPDFDKKSKEFLAGYVDLQKILTYVVLSEFNSYCLMSFWYLLHTYGDS